MAQVSYSFHRVYFRFGVTAGQDLAGFPQRGAAGVDILILCGLDYQNYQDYQPSRRLGKGMEREETRGGRPAGGG
ncbi:MAG: hypothetical protein AB1791_20710 [Chloroflexota bacterium]